MSTTPGARNEYSRGSQGSSGDFDSSRGRGRRPPRGFRSQPGSLPKGAAGLVFTGALLGALLLIVAEFTTLYRVHAVPSGSVVRTVASGSNHSYALIPIALLAVFLAVTFRQGGGRVALIGIGLAGVAALLIALVGDLPDARHGGVLGSAARGYVNARAKASAGLYMETLGAIILIATCGSGLLLTGVRDRPEPETTSATRREP